MEKKTVLIQGALEVETEELVSHLTDMTRREIGGFPFWEGTWAGETLVVCRTGVGTIAAACAATLGIQAFRPRVLINQGIAGSHSRDLHVGDVVVGERCIPIHDLITPMRKAGEGSDPAAWALWDPATGKAPAPVPADPAWVARFAKAPYAGGNKVTGTLGCGDVFNREADRIAWLRDRAGELCEDMESLSAYKVCGWLGVPCVGLRIISNNELTGEAYDREVGVALQRFVLEVLKG